MERQNIAHTLHNGERVTSIYAEAYFNDDYCDYKKPVEEIAETTKAQPNVGSTKDEWQSPSDHLIGIVDLIPPFTSKISRGITHQGILAIGNGVLQKERARFLEYMKKLMQENDIAWSHILEHEKNMVALKVKDIYQKILEDKRKILMNEINIFYESTLQDLEDYLRKEVANILNSAHANIISDLNTQIKEKLEYEKKVLGKVLKQRYDSEVKKIKHYYSLILNNEEYRNKKLINHALHERNDALQAFCRQIEAENLTSTMYVMCTERKKCRIKQFILDNYHKAEIAEKLQKIKEQQDIIDAFKERDRDILTINQEWEEKIKKILVLFLKFISFCLKLLPEQATFLLDLEKLVVLQLNEMHKTPSNTSSILVDEEKFNLFKFEEVEREGPICDKDPFIIVGDTSKKKLTPHGSRETLPSNVELPVIRLQRQFVYAKCDKFKEVKDLLEAQRCKCLDVKRKPHSSRGSRKPSPSTVNKPPQTPIESESSLETLLVDNIEILHHCPARKCQDPAKSYSFPYINDYLDFTEDNYRRVTAILGKLPPADVTPELINPRDIVWQELAFAETHEKYHHVATQYSSQEDVAAIFKPCPCVEALTEAFNEPEIKLEESRSKQIEQIMLKRQASLKQVINENPNLLKMFTDESFDFVYSIK